MKSFLNGKEKDMSTDAINALLLLLSEWTDKTFPAEKRDVAALNHLWMNLANALCNSNRTKVKAFRQEITSLRSSKHAGNPPISALNLRLHELVQADISELFLSIAVRQSMEQLILIEFATPSALQNWKQLVDTLLPLQMQFAIAENTDVKNILSPEE